MQVISVGSDNVAVFLVILGDLPDILMAARLFEDFIICFMPIGCDGKWSTRKFSQGMEVQTIDSKHERIQYAQGYQAENRYQQ